MAVVKCDRYDYSSVGKWLAEKMPWSTSICGSAWNWGTATLAGAAAEWGWNEGQRSMPLIVTLVFNTVWGEIMARILSVSGHRNTSN